jgi:hypothetical protein
MALSQVRLSVAVTASTVSNPRSAVSSTDAADVEPTEQIGLLMRYLRSSERGKRARRPGWVVDAVVRVLADDGGPMRRLS